MKRHLRLLFLASALVAGCTTGPAAESTQPQSPAALPAEGETGLAGDPGAGAQIFLDQNCGACHRLAAVGSTGTVGPDLDLSSASFAEVARIVAEGKAPMPAYADRLIPQQIADVATFVRAAQGANPAGDAPATPPTEP